jgi:flagellar biosynthesis/type III secretory pathway protein FliH
LAKEERITLRVNPSDLDAIRMHQVALLESVEGVEALEIVSDDTISPGGCIAETRELVVDAQLKAQLAEIIDQLTKP